MRGFAGWMVLGLATGCVVHRDVIVEQDDVSFDEAVQRVVVDLPAGDLEVRRTDGASIEVRRTVRWSGERPEVQAWVTDGVLTLDVDCRAMQWTCSVDTEILLPADAVIVADTGSGSIRVESTAGDHDLSTGSGDVELADLAGQISASTGSGALSAVGIVGGLTLDTGSGDVDVSDADLGALVATTGSGSLSIDLVGSPDRVWIESGSGDVSLALPAGSYRLSLQTGSGGVTVDGITADSGAPATIDIETGSGDVSVIGR